MVSVVTQGVNPRKSPRSQPLRGRHSRVACRTSKAGFQVSPYTGRAMELRDLAAKLGCEVHGNDSLPITGVAGMEVATATELTFLANPKYAHKVKHSRAG